MITKDQMMPLLIAVCPSFLPTWNEMQAEQDEEERLYYIELASLARHLVKLQIDGRTEDFGEVFSVIERLHVEGDDFVQNAVTIGLLEDIQNIAGNEGLNPGKFIPHLHPISKSWWLALNKFWNGEADTVALPEL